MRAAFFDIDGTLTSDRVWKGLMGYFRHHNLRRFTHTAFLSVHYPLYFLRRMRLLSTTTFRARWAANLSWYVRGYTLEQAAAVWDWTVENYLAGVWRTDVRAVLSSHLGDGDPVVLVSSGPLPLIQRVARELGTPYAVGTRFEVRDGRYTGRSLEPVCIGTYKASLAQALLRENGLEVDLRASSAYADSTTDLAMLEMVGRPVATYPDAELQAVARDRSWPVYPAA